MVHDCNILISMLLAIKFISVKGWVSKVFRYGCKEGASEASSLLVILIIVIVSCQYSTHNCGKTRALKCKTLGCVQQKKNSTHFLIQ